MNEMPDCSGKTVLITGANSGLGYEATKAFATNGATVIMACRSIDRGQQAASDIRNATGSVESTLSVRQCDLASLDSIETFATGVAGDVDSINVLCNNAGVMAIPRQETEDGFEMQFGVNHLGHFALTGHLLNLLIGSGRERRIVTHASGFHRSGELDFTDLHRERSYGKWEAYAQSKLANLLFAYELDRRLRAAGITETLSVACHPGYAATNLQYRGPEQTNSWLWMAFMKVANTLVAQSAAKGALPMLYASLAPGVGGGDYYGPGGFMDLRGPPTQQSSNKSSYDQQDAERLWETSEELTGVEYRFPE